MSITESKTILKASTIPHVELSFMNNTHFEEIEMVKSLGELISTFQEAETLSKDEEKQLSDTLQVWLDHTVAHFDRENQLMQKTAFPAFSIHSNEHEIALENMSLIVKNWNKNKNLSPVADYVFKQWPNWFNAHVSSMDMMTAKFAVMNGYTET